MGSRGRRSQPGSPVMDRETQSALDAMRDHFELVIDASEKRWETERRNQREALRVAAEANDKRFALLNGHREAMADLANRMVTRQESDSQRNAVMDKIDTLRGAIESRVEAEVKPMQARMEEFGRPNWALMTSMASAAFLVVAAVWMIIGLKIDATISPLSLEMSQVRTVAATSTERIAYLINLSTASTAADAASRADREQLNVRVRSLEGANSSRRTEMSVLDARMVEIETQFCARDNLSNLMHANDLRISSMLWRKVFDGSVYPTDNSFYPRVCNQSVVSTKGSQEQ